MCSHHIWRRHTIQSGHTCLIGFSLDVSYLKVENALVPKIQAMLEQSVSIVVTVLTMLTFQRFRSLFVRASD